MPAYLAHHGVKGMRWGVRKNRNGLSGRKIRRKGKEVAQGFKQAIQTTDKALLLRNVVSAGLGSAATIGVTALIGNPMVAATGVAAVQTVVTHWGEVGATEASELAVKMITKAVLQHDAMDANALDAMVSLEHHGVKGMRWGVRRSPDRLRMKATKLEKKAAKQRIKALKYEKKWLKKQGSLVNTLYPGDSMYNGERYKHKAIRLNKKAAKNDLRAVKLNKKALQRSAQMKPSEVDASVKASGRRYLSRVTS